ncbi:rhomboid family intramembrane serine protease [Alkalilimnicola sp. S0819]|uniref:rhomboid family intramembrane serine protease n=1 Tax=Alkalilimnicola sp. S0819 TaxID=2613922 RepID=UPI00126242D5|nr:rhomboid family intramembrane serine protease [Alkalilimnicola sp. S0819]KAB7624385.1 rhomboid family intramembrane serine protease [Alkalilimnicola sp. S0819]MPQ16212.1 rhomboid family intramembrane serine protease [Alkalilimnicola sp. S0819]
MSPDPAMGGYRAFPPVVTALLVLNGLVFLLQGAWGNELVYWLALWPLGLDTLFGAYAGPLPGFEPWQLLSYSVLHGGTLHLFANMFALWMFGVQLENYWGSRPFGVYYLVCVLGAALIQLYVATQAAQQGDVYPTVGASGGVFGILLAFAMMFPNQRIMLLFPPIPMKAKWFVMLYGAFELYAGLTGSQAGVAHFAHLGGMLFGFIMIMYWRGRLPLKPRRQLRG